MERQILSVSLPSTVSGVPSGQVSFLLFEWLASALFVTPIETFSAWKRLLSLPLTANSCLLAIFLQDLGGATAVRGHLAAYAIAPYLIKRTTRQLFVLAALALVIKDLRICRAPQRPALQNVPFVFVNFLAGVLAYRMRSVLINSMGRYTPWICYCLLWVSRPERIPHSLVFVLSAAVENSRPLGYR